MSPAVLWATTNDHQRPPTTTNDHQRAGTTESSGASPPLSPVSQSKLEIWFRQLPTPTAPLCLFLRPDLPDKSHRTCAKPSDEKEPNTYTSCARRRTIVLQYNARHGYEHTITDATEKARRKHEEGQAPFCFLAGLCCAFLSKSWPIQ